MAIEWYVRVGNASHGPFSSESLTQLARKGKVLPDTLVKKGTDANWVRAVAVKGLFTSAPHRPTVLLPQPVPAVRHQPQTTNYSKGDGVPRWLWEFMAVAAVLLCGVGMFAVWSHRQEVEQVPVEAANREVREAVAKAQDWIRQGRLGDVDQVEQALNRAAANRLATDKSQVAATMAAVQKAKPDRWAADVLKAAIDAISQKQFDRAQECLQQYLGSQHGTERQKAQTLLADISLATSDDEALRTLLAMDDKAFKSFVTGDTSRVELSHPVLTETWLATLTKNLVEASRQRVEKVRRAEAERVAEQARIAAEKEAKRREQIADETRGVK